MSVLVTEASSSVPADELQAAKQKKTALISALGDLEGDEQLLNEQQAALDKFVRAALTTNVAGMARQCFWWGTYVLDP